MTRASGGAQEVLVASAHVIEAGANLVADRIDLARAEVRDALVLSASRGAWALCAGLAFLTGWILSIAAIVSTLLALGVPVAGSIAAGALLSVGAGMGLLWMARRTSARGPR